MELPYFRYHPYPLRTGSVKRSGNTCVVCGQARGYIYSGPVYARKEYIDCICPWCRLKPTSLMEPSSEGVVGGVRSHGR
ncbi:MAG: CbrC family protein [Chloroflexota bacterium]